MIPLINRVRRLAEGTRWGGLALALAVSVCTLVGGLAWANALYARSGFPPRLIEGQLAFDAARTKGWYGALIARGTLDVYQRTQWVDFLFIAGLLATLFVLHVMFAKARHDAPGWQRLALWLAVLGPAIASADLWENTVTLTMLRAPLTFPAWLASLASTLSAIKWGWSVIGTSLVLVQLVALVWHRLTRGRGMRPAIRPDA
ncbi:MAG: hypothetical protein ACK6DP_04265 [Gemmatimonas sp.]|jgi:hypothetical protein|uniref:hypothetical protein n=1 Tax=Gemmatimonas sp. TaxID=1962908 RepID=UPI00391EFC93|nr:hypothetical protein [Gemmatimonadota bacterium]